MGKRGQHKPESAPDDGLTPADRKIICDILARYPEVERAVLFGSRAMGTFSRGSDIDLALEGDAVNKLTLARIGSDLEDSRLPFTVDVLHRSRKLTSEVEQHIRDHGRIFYEHPRKATSNNDVSQEWKLVKLRDIGMIDRGRSRHRPRYAAHLYNGPYPFIQTGDIRISGGRITSHSQTYSEAGLKQSKLWPAGTMCITIAANIAETAVLTYPACFPDSVVGFIADENKANVHFVEYMFRKIRRSIQHAASGSVQDNINLGTLDRLEFPLPPIREQNAIAAVLGSLDDKIEQNRRTCQALEKLARAIFRAWFVDFEPVHAKAAGATSFPGMPQSVFDSLPTNFSTSPLGLTPEGWEVAHWGDLATLEYGKSLRSYRGSNGQYQVYGTNGVIGRHSEYLAEGPGIIIGRKGAYRGVHYSPRAFWAIDTAFFLKPKREFDVKWAYYELLRNDINSMDSGSAIPSTSREDFYAVSACVPNRLLFDSFDSIVGPIFNWLDVIDVENTRLVELRDYLLPKLLSGQVRVRVSH